MRILTIHDLPFLVLIALGGFTTAGVADDQLNARLTITVTDTEGITTPARVHLIDADNTPQRVAGLPFWHDHVTFPGTVTFDLPPGTYRYAVERGPEFPRAVGSLTLVPGQDAERAITLTKHRDLTVEGY